MEEQIEVIEDIQDEVEEENMSEALNAIRKQKEALDWRIKIELDKSTDQDATPEQREMAKKKNTLTKIDYCTL